MNNRLTLLDLAGLLAKQTGRTKKESEEFLRIFIASLSEGVFADRIAKVKGLGTFKIIEVEDRESVNVNTGKRFVIPGHFKFTFTPDKELKELVNKPFSFFDTTEINTDIQFNDIDSTFEKEADESENEDIEIDEPSDISYPYQATKEEIPQESITKAEEAGNDEELILTETDKLPVVEESNDKNIEEVIETKEKEVLTEESSNIPNEQANTIVSKSEKKKKSNSTIWIFILLILFLIGIVVVAYFYLNAIPKNNQKPDIPIEKEFIPDPPAMEEDIPLNETEITEETPSPEIRDENPLPPSTTEEVITRVTIEPGSRLTLIALEHYGNKIFWVYLYEYNKDKIADPNNVPIGTEIAVPSPSLYGIKAKDRESIEKASILQTQILTTEK